MVLICGLPGSGKSTLAARLAPRLTADLLSSDGIRSESGLGGDYGQEAIDAVYRELNSRALAALRSGRSVVLDATFSSDRFRRQALLAAESIGADRAVIEVRADEQTALERVGRERAVSEAKEDVYRLLLGRFDPISEPHLTLDSSSTGVDALVAAAQAYLGAP